MTDISPEKWTPKLIAASPSSYKYKYKYKAIGPVAGLHAPSFSYSLKNPFGQCRSTAAAPEVYETRDTSVMLLPSSLNLFFFNKSEYIRPIRPY